VAARERPVDRGQRLWTTTIRQVGDGLRLARAGLGLSIAATAAAVGISTAEVSRIERARAPWVSLLTLVRLAAIVGLDLSVRLCPGGPPIRDAPQISLLADFAAELGTSLRWDTEVPLPRAGDQRAWDGMVQGNDWRFGVEAETAPRDGQALVRRLQLKLRDGYVDGVILVLRDTRQARAFVIAAEPELKSPFPTSARDVLAALRRGDRPPGSGIVVLPWKSRTRLRPS
jgi:transcriptional regulator with XRE-family HTH domain